MVTILKTTPAIANQWISRAAGALTKTREIVGVAGRFLSEYRDDLRMARERGVRRVMSEGECVAKELMRIDAKWNLDAHDRVRGFRGTCIEGVGFDEITQDHLQEVIENNRFFDVKPDGQWCGHYAKDKVRVYAIGNMTDAAGYAAETVYRPICVSSRIGYSEKIVGWRKAARGKPRTAILLAISGRGSHIKANRDTDPQLHDCSYLVADSKADVRIDGAWALTDRYNPDEIVTLTRRFKRVFSLSGAERVALWDPRLFEKVRSSKVCIWGGA